MTFEHPISEDDLHAYIDRALPANRHAEVEAHLESHPDVAKRVRGFSGQREMLREALAPVLEEPLPPELSVKRIVAASRRPSPQAWRSAAAAAVLLLIGGGGGWLLHATVEPQSRGIAALVQEASENYVVYSPDRERPVELKAVDRQALVSWMSERLRRPVSAPDLSALGYRFMGGRLVATAHGPAALFMYDDDHGSRLVMLEREMEIEKNAPMSQHAKQGLTGFGWSKNGLGYSLVGRAAPDVLHPLADEVRRQVASTT